MSFLTLIDNRFTVQVIESDRYLIYDTITQESCECDKFEIEEKITEYATEISTIETKRDTDEELLEWTRANFETTLLGKQLEYFETEKEKYQKRLDIINTFINP